METDLQPDLIRKLARWCADCPSPLPDSAISYAERAIADTVGCILAGADDPSVVSAGRIVTEVSSSRSSSVRHAGPVPATWAAMVNGCAAHALELDDNFFPAITHVSAVLVPALFALGEEIDADGTSVVRAYVAGLEVEAQIGKAVNPSHYAKGWHATSTIGTLGAAAACATLMKLDGDTITHAMSIAFSLAGGSKKQFGSMVKPMHAGFAAMHGVMSAQLAAAGLKGNESVFQGQWSFPEMFADGSSGDTIVPALYPDAPLAIDDCAPVAKLYPSCGSTHLGVDAILSLRARPEFSPADIIGVDIHMPPSMIANLRYSEPVDEVQARFSMNYCAAVALTCGVPRLSHFTPEAVRDPAVVPLLKLVHMHAREPSAESSRLPFAGDCIVQIHMKGGTVLEQRAEYPKGSTQNPLTPEEQRDKFFDCVAERLGEVQVRQIYSKLLGFSQLLSINEVTLAFRQNNDGNDAPRSVRLRSRFF